MAEPLFLRAIFRLIGEVALREGRRWKRAFLAAAERPREVQAELLNEVIRLQENTRFGRAHHFRSIHQLADFRREVPILRYEDFEPYLADVRRGQFDALLNTKTVHMFAMTSGTTATRKTIPVTPRYLADYRRGFTIWGLDLFDAYPNMLLKPSLQLASDWDEFRTEAGIPCGSVSGLTAQMQKRIVRRYYTFPAAAVKLKDAAAKNYVALRATLPRRDLTLIVSANPSTFIRLAQFGDEYKEALIRDVHDGTLSAKLAIEPDLREHLCRRLPRKNPARAKELEAVVHRTGHLYPGDCFPELQVLGHWTGGSVGLYVRHMPKYYGNHPVIRDLGLLASEGRFSIPFENNTASGVLDVTSHFFEFIPEEEIDFPKPTVLAAHEVVEGRTYYLLPTTFYGLYRYNLYDVVRVTGFFKKTPLIEFLNKGSLFANLTGEKLSEFQVNAALKRAAAELNLFLTAFTLAPQFDEKRPNYGLFIERGDLDGPVEAAALAAAVDRYLRELNTEYDAKRASERLGPVQTVLLASGAWAAWDRERLARTGGTVEQYKRPCLIADPNFADQMPHWTP
jgi:hypothetical protein